MSRFRVTTAPEALPGECFACRGTSRQFFIDLNLQFEFHGAVYICSDCVEEITGLVGYLSPKAADKLQVRVSELESRIYALTRKEQGLEEAVRGLTVARTVNGHSPDILDGNGDSPPVAGSESQVREEPVGDGERTPDEPSHDEGVGELHPNGVSDDRESDFTLKL